MAMTFPRSCKTAGCFNAAETLDDWCFVCHLDGAAPGLIDLFIGERIKAARAAIGLNQSELARRLGLDGSVLALWEQDKRQVPRYRVPALAHALEVDMAYLLHGGELAIESREKRPAGQVWRAAPEPRMRQLPDRLYDWEVLCIACGMAVWVKWTEPHAQNEMKASRFRCGQCRGSVVISAADVGFQHTVAQAFMPRYSQPSLRNGWRQVSKSA